MDPRVKREEKQKEVEYSMSLHIDLGSLVSFFKSARASRRGSSQRGSLGQYLDLLFNGEVCMADDGDFIFTEEHDYEKGFADHYNEYIKPHFQAFEEKRILALYKMRKRMFISVPLSIFIIIADILLLIYVDIPTEDYDFAIGFPIAGIIGLAVYSYWPVKKYKSSLKETIFPLIFMFFGDKFTYDPDGRIRMSVLKPSDIIPSHNEYHPEDHLKGEYLDVGLELTEARLISRSRDSKGNTRRRQVWRGLFILFTPHKNFKGKTIVTKDKGAVLNWLKDKFNKDMDKVGLEDPLFEDKFEVYSNDQVEARYLLTTAFMQRLMDLAGLFEDAALQCSFYDDKLLVMVPFNRNMFEPGSAFEPALVADVHGILYEMHLIFQIIEILKLNLKIGL